MFGHYGRPVAVVALRLAVVGDVFDVFRLFTFVDGPFVEAVVVVAMYRLLGRHFIFA